MSSFVYTSVGWLRRNLSWSNRRQAWEERLGAALVLGGLVLAIWLSRGWNTSQQLLLWGMLGLALAVVLRRGWIKLLGPVLFYDMIRTARRGRYALVRSLYALVLLIIVLCVYVGWFMEHRDPIADLLTAAPVPAAELAGFAASFFIVFMAIQMAAVFFLTPAYTAGVLAEEKERKTLEALLATDLRNREIVLGMFVSRVANLLLFLITGLPILGFLQLLGGVDPNLVLAGFAVAGLTLLSLAGLSILNSCLARKPRDAIVRTYLMAGLYLALSGSSWLLLVPTLNLATFPSTDTWTSPITVQDLVEWLNTGNVGAMTVLLAQDVRAGKALAAVLPPALANYAWFHGLVALTCCGWAVLRLRSEALAEETAAAPKRAKGRGVPLRRRRFYLGLRPRVTERPMLWKELFVDQGARRGLVRRLLTGLFVAAVFWPVLQIVYFFDRFLPLETEDRLRDALGFWVRGISVLVGCFMLLQVATRAAGSVSGERGQQTLDGLLATPLQNRTILRAKWLGSLLSPRWAALCLLTVWLVGLTAGAVHPLAMPAFWFTWFVYACYVSALGLWFSVASRTTHRAIFGTLLAAVAVLLVAFLAMQDLADTWVSQELAASVMPPLALGLLPFSAAEFQFWLSSSLTWRALTFPLSLALWSSAAYVLWVLANIRFRIVTGRADPPTRSAEVAVPLSRELQAILHEPVAPSMAGAATTVVHTAPPNTYRSSVATQRGLIVAATHDSDGLAADAELSLPDGPGWRRRLLHAVVLLLPGCLLVGGYAFLHVDSERDYREATAEANRLDPGWRLEELEARRVVLPPDENSALRVIEAKRLIPEKPYQQEFYDLMNDVVSEKQLSPEQSQALASELEGSKAALDTARAIKDYPQGRMPVTFSRDGISTLLPHTQDARAVANLLQWDAMLRAQQHDIEGALDSCHALINTSRAIGDEPTLISVLVRIAIRAIGLRQIERVLAQGEPGESGLRALQQLLEEDDRDPLLLHGLRGERALSDRLLQAIQDGQVGEDTVRGSRTPRTGIYYPTFGEVMIFLAGSLKTQRAVLLRLHTANVEAAKLPMHLQRAAIPAVPLVKGKLLPIVGLFMPAIGKVAEAQSRTAAELRSALVVLALERYRREHGEWPTSLDALVPSHLGAIPQDPYNGKSLCYRQVGDGVVVYSVGPDGQDNGGKLDRKNYLVSGIDMGIRLWNVERRRQPAARTLVGPPVPPGLR